LNRETVRFPIIADLLLGKDGRNESYRNGKDLKGAGEQGSWGEGVKWAATAAYFHVAPRYVQLSY
jgi:hypothetical protein